MIKLGIGIDCSISFDWYYIYNIYSNSFILPPYCILVSQVLNTHLELERHKQIQYFTQHSSVSSTYTLGSLKGYLRSR